MLPAAGRGAGGSPRHLPPPSPCNTSKARLALYGGINPCARQCSREVLAGCVAGLSNHFAGRKKWDGEGKKRKQKNKNPQPNPKPVLFKGEETASDVCCPSEMVGNAGLKDAWKSVAQSRLVCLSKGGNKTAGNQGMLWSSLCESQKRVILFKMPYCISLWRTVKWFRARACIPLPFSELVLFIRILGICLSCFVESTFHFIQTKESLTHTVTELQDRQGWTTHVWVLTPSGFLSTGFIKDPFASLPAVCRPLWAFPELCPHLPRTMAALHSPGTPASVCYSLTSLKAGACKCHKLQRWASNKQRCKTESRENTFLLDCFSLVFKLNFFLNQTNNPPTIQHSLDQLTKLGRKK